MNRRKTELKLTEAAEILQAKDRPDLALTCIRLAPVVNSLQDAKAIADGYSFNEPLDMAEVETMARLVETADKIIEEIEKG